MPTPEQSEFAFSEGSPEPDGMPHWRAEWMRRAEDLCRRLGAPLNHRVEVRLTQGPVLRGRLCLDEEQLWPDGNRHRLVLRIGRATFRLGEMESILCMDAAPDAGDERKELPAAPRMEG